MQLFHSLFICFDIEQLGLLQIYIFMLYKQYRQNIKTTLPINLHFNNRRINLLIYCYIMGKNLQFEKKNTFYMKKTYSTSTSNP